MNPTTPINTSRMYALLLRLALIFAMVSSGCQFFSQQFTEPTATLSVAPTKTKAPLATLPPTPTQKQSQETESPAQTESPASTPTPIPTETPAGYYRNNPAGFSLILPEHFELVSEDGSQTELFDDQKNVSVFFLTGPANEPENLDEIIEAILSASMPDTEYTLNDEYRIPLANGLEAQAKDASMDVSGSVLLWKFGYIYLDGQSYVMITLGLEEDIADRQEEIDAAYASVELFLPPTAFGLSSSETLTQVGGDPEPEDLDPATTTEGAGGYTGMLFAGLVRLNPQLQVEPDLAESWQINDDGTVYTFILRQGLTFADGKPLTAQNVKDSWERAADPKTESSTASTYLGDIVGFKDRLAGKASTVSGIKVMDERTLQVTVDAPKPYFLAKLTYPSSFIVDTSQATDNPDDWVWSPNSSGPYTLKDYKATEGIAFERNEKFYSPAAILNLQFIFYPGGSILSRYEDGTLDIAPLYGQTALNARRPEDTHHAEWLSTTTLCTHYIQMNNTLAPFDDPMVRQAFALAIDRSLLVERLSNNLDLPALSILPPGMPGSSATAQIAAYNTAAAKAALAASTYAGNLPAITLNAGGDGSSQRDDVDMLVEMWRQVLGVEVSVEYLDPYNYTEAARSRHDHMVLYGWCADYPDPQNFLDVLYQSDSEFNVAGYTNPEVDELLAQANITFDPAERLALYNKIEKMLLDDFAVTPLYNPVDDVLVKSRVQGFVLSPMEVSLERQLSLTP